MFSTLAATLQVSLRRTRAAWPIVLAAGLTCVLACALLAAGPIYAGAVSIAGLHRVLADAPVAQGNVQVTLRATPDRAGAIDDGVTDGIAGALGPVAGTIVRSARSDTFDLPVGQPGPIPDLVDLGYQEGLEERATLVDGAWPADPAADASGPVPVALAAQVAEPLGLRVGSSLTLTSRAEPDFVVPIEVVGIFRVDDPRDPAWWDDAQVLDGVVTSTSFATHGPFFTTERQLLDRATVRQAALTWRAFPSWPSLTVEGIGRLRAGLADLDGRLEAAADGLPVTVETGLPAILATAERSLLVSRTGVLLLVVQLAVLAAYAVLLSAALLVEHRRVDTAMLRSRGAGPIRLAALTLVEGLLLTVPAALIGPWLALAALGMFNVIGPLAEIGLRIDPQVSVEAYLAAGIAAVACLIALILPALPGRRSFAAVQGGRTRAATRPAGQRLGLDIALVAVAAIGLWQLRFYGAPLTRTVQGSVGIDPLLVATPAIGLLAGAVIALRLLPLLAGAIERITSRGRGLVSSLGARQLARRPLRYTRAALLLMLAMAMGVFAVSYTWTWTASQHDQASHQVGADVRVTPGTRTADLPRWALDQAYAGLPGTPVRMPVDRSSVEAARSERGELVALDAAVAPGVVVMRPDVAGTAPDALFEPLAAARPTLEAVRLPGEPRQVRLVVEPDIRSLERLDAEGTATDVDPAELADVRGLSASVVVRDATGALYRFGSQDGVLGGGARPMTVPLGAAADPTASFAYPLDLVAVSVDVRLPADLTTSDASVAVRSVEATDATAGDDTGWSAVPMELAGGWRVTSAVAGAPHELVERPTSSTDLSATTGGPGLSLIGGVDRYGRGTVLTFAPAALASIAAAPIPVVASTAFLEANARTVGERMPLEIGGVRRMIEISAVVDAVPTVDPDVPAIVADLPTVTLARFEGSDAVDPATEWWFDVPPTDQAAVVTALETRPIASREVLTITGRERALSTDPVALGIIGALAIGFVAAALFAIVGFIVSAAVSARERVTEFALLRALGLSSRQLSSWLSLENAVLAGVSLVAGSLLGLVIAWVVLPFVTVTQEARTPYPPVALEVPWLTIAILEIVAIVALATTVIVMAWLLRRVGLASALRMGED